jgi:ATP-dependent phosphofructokinase / diphosphate-dependent phosphofructokinase
MTANRNPIRRVAMLFAGGPAPGANAVISSAALSFLDAGIEVIGIKHGYSRIMDYSPDKPLVEGHAYLRIDNRMLPHARTSQGIMIGTARSNPGKLVTSPADLGDPGKTAPLRRVYDALRSLEVDALISIGGDDTLKTANKLQMFQATLPADLPRMPVVHLPKTIDNDYSGIDFTFGYFTAVDTLAVEIRNLNYDASSSSSYFLCESMGRSAGWLAYGAAIAGEAAMVISVEDIHGPLRLQEQITDPVTGQVKSKPVVDLDRLVDKMVRVMQRRDAAGRHYGVIVVAEGLAEYLPQAVLEGIPRDDHGHIAISAVNLSRIVADRLAKAYQKATGQARKVTPLQLGYEARCATPHAFDIMLGSQIGVGAYRALIEEQLSGVMVSVSGQLDLSFVPFEQLVDQQTLVTKVRFIERTSDFYRLARFSESYVDD